MKSMCDSTTISLRREWGTVLLIAMIGLGLTLIPYLLGYAMPQEGVSFTGLLMNPEDSQTYYAKMLQGYDGHLLYTIPFTSETHAPAFVGVFYIWLGHLARVLGVSLEATWHASRLVADLILFLASYAFIRSFLAAQATRWTAYLLTLFGSGLGWLLFALNQPYWLDAFPVDFKQPGAHFFFTALTFPHVALGTALLIAGIWLIWFMNTQDQRQTWLFASLAGIVNLALGIAYPFLIYLIALITAFYWLFLALSARRILWRRALILALPLLISSPLYVYYAYTLQINAVFRAWDAQAVTPSAPWPHYLVAYAAMLLLGLAHWRARPQQRKQVAILWLWVLATTILIFAPLKPQRRFVQGVHLPLSILAAAGFHEALRPWLLQTRPLDWLLARPRYTVEGLSRLLLVGFLAFMSLSNLYVLASTSVSAVFQQPDPLFRPTDELAVTAWLRARGPKTAVVLGDYQTGNYVAAHAGQPVFLGHWAETMDYEEKVMAVASFYRSDTSDGWRREFLRRHGIDLVWHGPRERRLGDFDPQTAGYLQSVHVHESITLYSVALPAS